MALTKPSKQATTRPFYFGVEFAYGSEFSQVKSLVDAVKGYTNFFVIGSVLLTFNRTALDESCNYLNSSGLNFIVLITSFPMYNSTNGYPGNDTVFDWMGNATQKYSNYLLGFYRFNEPGGNQIDKAKFQLVSNASSYADAANQYVYNLGGLINYYAAYGGRTGEPTAKIFTSDYGLYWFDYASGYSTVFGEFVGNQSREATIALDRGAAESFGKPWGVIVTWKYTKEPFLESNYSMYVDLSQAYSAGATYEVVFSYPTVTVPGSYGTLTPDDLKTLQKFWNDIHTNPGQFCSSPGDVAYVLPANFGFGFRSEGDTIWGLFPASSDTYTAKIWGDTQFLMMMYPSELDVIYDYPTVIQPTLKIYSKVFYYNQTVM